MREPKPKGKRGKSANPHGRLSMKLSTRQERFCLNYIKLDSAGEAARVAGYSPKYAAQNCDKLLKNTKIVERISELRKKAEDATIADVKERKQRLTEIARATIPDYVAEDSIKVDKKSPNVGAVAEITTKTRVFRKGGEPVNITNLKLHNPIQAIDLLNKMDGVYNEQPVINQDNRTMNIIVLDGETKDLISQVKDRTGKLLGADENHQNL